MEFKVIIELTVKADSIGDATYVLDQVLDGGTLQDEVANHEFDAGPVEIKSLLVKPG